MARKGDATAAAEWRTFIPYQDVVMTSPNTAVLAAGERAHTKGPFAVHHQSTPCTIAGFYHVTEVGNDRPAVAYVHSREDALLFAAAPDMFEALKAYEAWEADVIMSADWSGGTPRLTQAQWDRLIELQTMRNPAIAKAEGLANLADATPKNPLPGEIAP